MKRSILTFALLASSPGFGAPAADLSQADAQKAAAEADLLGSDQSLRSSTVTAMRALIQFGDSDIRGAITSAYRAYGSFKTSENLDRTHKQGLLAKASLGAPGTVNLSEGEAAFLASSTSFRRLDPSFLTAGEDAKVAEEFERKTGIRRQDFLNMMASAAENRLYVSDPKLAEKIDAEFDGFVAKIPNPEFRAKVKGALSLVPSLSRHKLLVQAVQNMVQLAGVKPGGESTDALAQDAPAVTRSPAAAEGDAAKGPESAPLPEELATLAREGSLNSDGMAKAGEAGAAAALKLDSVVSAAIHTDKENENETIFERVSRRYRIVSLRLAPPKAPREKPAEP